jgi:hypothetical protein
MAVQALTAEYITLGTAGNISAFCKSATLTIDAAQLDTTDFASGGWTEMIGGLRSATLAIELMDDFAAGSIDDDIYADLGNVVAFALRADNGAISTSNPEYQGFVLVTSWNAGGAVGDLASKSLSFPVTGAIVRDVTP